MAKAKVIFERTSGRKNFIKGGKLPTNSTQALSQKITDQVKAHIAEDQQMIVASAVRQQYVHMAIAYFSAMLHGAKELIEDSQVPVVIDDAPEVVGKRYVKSKRSYGDVRIKRRVLARGSFMASVTQVERLRYGKSLKTPNAPSKVSVVLRVYWKKMSKDYAKRKPESRRFFYKRLNSDTKSSRVAFHAMADEWSRKARLVSSYQKSKMTYTYDQATGTLKTQFRINTPSLGPQFDFLRQAFFSGNPNVTVPDLGSEGASGIARAEYLRPFLRHFAAKMGQDWRNAMKGMASAGVSQKDIEHAIKDAPLMEGGQATGNPLLQANKIDKLIFGAKRKR